MRLLEFRRQKGWVGKLHFIGIGGIGMSGIAEILHNLGYEVQGSDQSIESDNVKRLMKLGIKVIKGHNAENIHNAEVVVISSAIKPDCPEITEAKKLRIPVIKRSEMLAELMRRKISIAISGTHGKTTTTSLIACMFERAELNPTVINGGIINNRATNAYNGTGDYVIAEADESDETFIRIPSTIAVVTNIDPEHLDYYKNFSNYKDAFYKFVYNIPFYGFAVACADHPVVLELINNITERKIISYGIDNENANIRAVNIRQESNYYIYDCIVNLNNHRIIKDIKLPLLGLHNLLNSLAAIATGVELGFDEHLLKEAFKDFQGVKRRFTLVGEFNEISLIDDYAHHPEEVKVVLNTANIIKNSRKQGRIISIFQPHRYSRFEHLFEELIDCFNGTDILYISDIYGAGEVPIEGVTSEKLIAAIKEKNKHIIINKLKGEEELEHIIYNIASPKDLVIFMGAGNITHWVHNLESKLNTIKSE